MLQFARLQHTIYEYNFHSLNLESHNVEEINDHFLVTTCSLSNSTGPGLVDARCFCARAGWVTRAPKYVTFGCREFEFVQS